MLDLVGLDISSPFGYARAFSFSCFVIRDTVSRISSFVRVGGLTYHYDANRLCEWMGIGSILLLNEVHND